MERRVSDNSTKSRMKNFGLRVRRFGSGSLGSSSPKTDRELGSPMTPGSPEPMVQKFVAELPADEVPIAPAPPSPSFDDAEQGGVSSSEDPAFNKLLAALRSLKEAIQRSEIDLSSLETDDFEPYESSRDTILRLCQELVYRSRESYRLDHLSQANSTELLNSMGNGRALNLHEAMGDGWYAAINEFRDIVENQKLFVTSYLTAQFRLYSPDAASRSFEYLFQQSYLSDGEDRPTQRTHHELQHSSWFMRRHAGLFTLLGKLQADFDQVEGLLLEFRIGKHPQMMSRHHDIVPDGDTILEFLNIQNPAIPKLTFRVFASVLKAASPYFAQVLSVSATGNQSSILRISQDSLQTKIYRMPQEEPNKCDSLTILLSAAHYQLEKIPKHIKFNEFVSMAEVCHRYQCTSPIEMIVKHEWLQQWLNKANVDNPDGMLLISYCFGLRRLFTTTSKSTILNMSTASQSHQLWPEEVRNKISATRSAKFAQVHSACVAAVREFLPVRLPENSIASASKSQTKPRCPRGSQQCDAVNLGWLLLKFDELGILAKVMNIADMKDTSLAIEQSLKYLITELCNFKDVPQAHDPPIHNGICDYPSTFRTTINNIYNNITGLTLFDVAGKGGWALSKDHAETLGLTNESGVQMMELSAAIPVKARHTATVADEPISLRIMSYISSIEDLQAIAMVNKGYYTTFKKHELHLMKNLVKLTKSGAGAKKGAAAGSLHKNICDKPTSPQSLTTFSRTSAMTSMVNVGSDAQYIWNGRTIPHEENDRPITITANAVSNIDAKQYQLNSQADSYTGFARQTTIEDECNMKFLPSDRAHLQKSLVVEGRKHLRLETDQTLRSGMGSSSALNS